MKPTIILRFRDDLSCAWCGRIGLVERRFMLCARCESQRIEHLLARNCTANHAARSIRAEFQRAKRPGLFRRFVLCLNRLSS